MNLRFDLTTTNLDGLFRIDHKPIADSRGFLSRLYCEQNFKYLGLATPVAQINQTFTKKKGTVRGLHFQYPPHTEAKVVSCIRGEVFDVAIDLRKNSPTFLKWHAEYLTENKQSSLYIPAGFAHGFQTLVDKCQLLYFHSNFHNQESEGVLNALDPALNIKWPHKITEMSDRDRLSPALVNDFEGIQL